MPQVSVQSQHRESKQVRNTKPTHNAQLLQVVESRFATPNGGVGLWDVEIRAVRSTWRVVQACPGRTVNRIRAVQSVVWVHESAVEEERVII